MGLHEMGDQSSTHSEIMILFKLFVLSLPATLLPYVRPAHGHTAFGLALVLGVLLQAIIPPRRKGFVPLIVVTIIFTLIYSFI
jgi:hypothetical protein